MQLLSTPLPEYDQWIDDAENYQRAVRRIDELRAAARVNSVLQTESNTGMLSCHDPFWDFRNCHTTAVEFQGSNIFNPNYWIS